VYLSSSKDAIYAATRNLFVFGPNSEARIVEFHASVDGTSAHFNNVVTEAIVGRDARIDHYRVQNENTASTHVAALYVQQDKSSLFRSHSFDFGAAISRHTIMALLEGQASEAILNGLYMPKGTQHHDTWMWVEHCQENIPSHELYKGILQDEGSATFTGRIYVHPEAQKTDAKQTNQNLLLSDSARVNTKPQLEIYADDVKCTHGATVGQLDMQSLFYLMSRGVAREAARELLVLAFASEVTEGIRDERLRGRVQTILQSRLRA
jgi:Fe-S cluster assembly protein SufD